MSFISAHEGLTFVRLVAPYIRLRFIRDIMPLNQIQGPAGLVIALRSNGHLSIRSYRLLVHVHLGGIRTTVWNLVRLLHAAFRKSDHRIVVIAGSLKGMYKSAGLSAMSCEGYFP